jgi:hypothetical protein
LINNMRGLATDPPGLGSPLLLLVISAMATLVLHLMSESIHPGLVVLPCVALNSSYYLVRYFQRRGIIQRDAVAGGDAWPVAQLFPGKAEHTYYPSAAFLGLAYSVLFSDNILPSKNISDMRWPEDGVSIALVVAYFLGLAANAVVLIQARHVCKVEDNVTCATGHEMRCERCTVEQAALDKPQDPPPTYPRVLDALSKSLTVSAIQCGTLLAVTPSSPGVLWALVAAAGLTIAHRLVFILCAMRPVDWPMTRVFPSKSRYMAFHIGNVVIFCLSIFAAMFAVRDERLAWTAGALARMVLVAQLVPIASNAYVFIQSMEAARAEARAACLREGHRWKCMRWCSVAQDAEMGAAGEKTVTETFTEVRFLCFI